MKKRSRREMSLLRHKRLRKGIAGTAERPRLSVYRSGRQIYAQLIDDVARKTVCAANSLMADVKPDLADKSRVEQAKVVGTVIGKKASEAGFKQVIFDRGGFKYHGCVKALADGAREAGLEF